MEAPMDHKALMEVSLQGAELYPHPDKVALLCLSINTCIQLNSHNKSSIKLAVP